MAIALLIFGTVFAALCVWLGVRIVNRRERWAKWMLAGVIMPIVYVASYSPAALACSLGLLPYELHYVYFPVTRMLRLAPEPFREAVVWCNWAWSE